MVDVAIDAMAEFMRSGRNAHHGGLFAAGAATDAVMDGARAAVGKLLGGTPEGVVFGPNMTAMRFSTAVGRTLSPGDEIRRVRLAEMLGSAAAPRRTGRNRRPRSTTRPAGRPYLAAGVSFGSSRPSTAGQQDARLSSTGRGQPRPA